MKGILKVHLPSLVPTLRPIHTKIKEHRSTQFALGRYIILQSSYCSILLLSHAVHGLLELDHQEGRLFPAVTALTFDNQDSSLLLLPYGSYCVLVIGLDGYSSCSQFIHRHRKLGGGGAGGPNAKKQ